MAPDTAERSGEGGPVEGGVLIGVGLAAVFGGMGGFFLLMMQAWGSEPGSAASPLFPAALGLSFVGIVPGGLGEMTKRAARGNKAKR